MALNISLTSVINSDAEGSIAQTLQAVVNGEIDPSSAAKIVDETVVGQIQAAHGKDVIRPVGWRQYLWICLGKAAEQIPYDHVGGDRLVNLILALQSLPSRTLSYTYDGKPEQDELWNITPGNGYGGLEQWLWEAHEGMLLRCLLESVSSSITPSISINSQANLSNFVSTTQETLLAENKRVMPLLQLPTLTSQLSWPACLLRVW
jgi:hypothetical protein